MIVFAKFILSNLLGRNDTMKKMTYTLICLQTFCFTNGLFAQENGDSLPPRDQGLWQTLLMLSSALILFYFILWRPEQQRRKAQENQRSSLKKGDRVTAVGIIGTVIRVQEHTVILKMYDGSKIEVVKGAITDIIPGNEDDAKKAEKEDKNLQLVEK
jgi:preprotein translocase subunit YajC